MLFYVGFYSCDLLRHEHRYASPAAENKMNYVISALLEATDCAFEVVSPAGTRENRYLKGKRYSLSDRVNLKTFPSFSSDWKLLRGIGYLFTRITFFLYLLFRVKAEDHLIVYHSLAYMSMIKLIRCLKRCKLTIEVEEIYADVMENTELRDRELRFLDCADAFLFPTKQLSELVNKGGKPEGIVHGTFNVEPNRKCSFFMDNEEKMIHCVYAGTLDPRKGGAIAAATTAEFLPENYHIHILGFGSQDEIQNMKDLADEISSRSRAKVTYDGLLAGEDYIRFIQSCRIGLSTQNPDAAFNATSFPSKVLMYMSNGLRVVSVRIPAIETSAVGDLIFYYEDQDPKEIARVIQSISFDDGYDSRSHLHMLHKDFVEKLKRLMSW